MFSFMPLGQFFNEDVLKKVKESKPEPANNCRVTKRELVLVDVRSDDSTLKNTIREVSELVDEHGGFVQRFWAHIAIATFRTIIEGGAFRQALSERFGADARVLYGNCVSMEGTFGDRHLLNYGLFVPGLAEAMDILAELEYGTMRAHDFPAWDSPVEEERGNT